LHRFSSIPIVNAELGAYKNPDSNIKTTNIPMKRKKSPKVERSKINLTIHPDIMKFAAELSNKRRRSVARLFEDLVESEWNRVNGIHPNYGMPMYTPMQQLYQPAPHYYQTPAIPKS
jgi:hypothetical protein